MTPECPQAVPPVAPAARYSWARPADPGTGGGAGAVLGAGGPRQLAPTAGLGMLQRILVVAGSKWAIPILDVLARRPARYNRLLAELEPIAPKVLTQTLRRLEDEGLVTSDAVGRVGRAYSLTDWGARIRAELVPLRRLAADEEEDAARRDARRSA